MGIFYHLMTFGLLASMATFAAGNASTITQSCPTGYRVNLLATQGTPSSTSTLQANCIDEDECRNPLLRCGDTAECVNTAGSFFCRCKKGYEPAARSYGKPLCVDANECAAGRGRNSNFENKNYCGDNEVCYNTIGSYDCACKPGFIINPTYGCVPIGFNINQPTVAIQAPTA